MSVKERKRIEIQKRKFQLEQERITKPGECNKFLTAVINKSVVESVCGSKIIELLAKMDFKVELTSRTTPNTVSWKRTVPKKGNVGEIVDFGDTGKKEPFLLIIYSACYFVKTAKDNQLLAKIQASQKDLPTHPVSTTLVIYGLKEFCRRNENAIGMKEMEIKLTQIQLLANCSHRLHETPDDIALTVAQMSKAVAEEPFKSKQNLKLDQEQFYLTSDTKINANEDVVSLARLWHTQLIALPKVTYEVAKSITKEYPMPRVLIKAYRKSSNPPQKMLADLPIIRTGPLNKTRKIGPELSRKIYTLMMSSNPDEIL